MNNILQFFLRFKNGITNGAGTFIGFDDVMKGINLINQGQKLPGIMTILQGVSTFVAFYFIGK